MHELILQGCDDSTRIEVPLYADQAMFLADLVEKFTAASVNGCQPTMKIRALCGAFDLDTGRACEEDLGHEGDHQVEYEDEGEFVCVARWPRQP